ncbi:MAG TPA: tryptophan-rich sensory protein [Pirellulales bacterium]|nr:tryptophan-rich sensory protein [Pirellulales bacterium]
MVSFWHRSVSAGLLLVPYLAWVTFAAALNYAFWQMNA